MEQTGMELERGLFDEDSYDCLRNQKVTMFIQNTFEFLKDNSLSSIVSWNHNGDVFLIKEPKEFADKVLKERFGHKNLASFTRQLNFYGFQRSACQVDQRAFWHPAFRKTSSLKQLANIRRRRRTERKDSMKTRSKNEDFLKKSSISTDKQLQTLSGEAEAQEKPHNFSQGMPYSNESPQKQKPQQFLSNRTTVQEFLEPAFLSMVDDAINDIREKRLWLQKENEKDDGFEALLQALILKIHPRS